MVADTASAALIAADGTVDWWCPSRFDAAPLLTRLLEPTGACLRVGPGAPGRPAAGEQRYRDGSLVLLTRLAGAESLVEIIDVLPWEGGGSPPGRLVRRLSVLRGPVDVAVDVVPGGDPRDVSAWSEGVAWDAAVVRCGLAFSLASQPPPAPARPLRRVVATAGIRLETGQTLVVTVDRPAERMPPPLSGDAAARLADRTTTAWRRVADTAEVEGPWAHPAIRSLLVVSALSGAGGPVSSPVTSLPRVVGGERNADGRVVPVVHAAAWATVAAACGLGEQSEAAERWLAAALDLDPPLPSVLAVDGTAPATEAHIPALSGWRRSQPVVAGSNGPDRVSAEPAAAAISVTSTPPWSRLVAHADWLADNATGPEASVWDLRGPPQRWISSRLTARAGLIAVAAAARRRNPLDLDAAGWLVMARALEGALQTEADGVLRVASGLTGTAGTDAALVRVAWLGPWPADDPVVRATLERLIERNSEGGWLHAWPVDIDDGLPGSEPCSVVATLWLARALALAGRWEEAHERMERAVDLAGPLHLFPESVNGTTGAPLGNLPSTPAHVAFVEAALALARAPG